MKLEELQENMANEIDNLRKTIEEREIQTQVKLFENSCPFCAV
jgi:hypothetical protein